MPEIVDEPSDYAFVRSTVSAMPAVFDLQPILGADRSRWLGVTETGGLVTIDADRDTFDEKPGTLELEEPILRLSPDGSLASIASRRGDVVYLVDVATGRTTIELPREDDVNMTIPMAFLERDGRLLFIHAPVWNRLDIRDARTGEVLTKRTLPENAEQPHYIDYFHGELFISPDGKRIVDAGWVWHPVGIVTTWSIEAWFHNAWESEDGPSRRELLERDDLDSPLCWISNKRLIVLGHPSALIFDATTGEVKQSVTGPKGDFAFDRVLYSMDPISIWNIERGTRLACDPLVRNARYHPTAKTLLAGGTHVRVTGGAPVTTPKVVELARRLAEDRHFDGLTVLGDALEASGCKDREMLAHCHAPGEHHDRCWVLDRLIKG